MKKMLALVPAIFLASCPAARVPAEDYDITVFPPDDGGDSELAAISPACRQACANLARLGCPEAKKAGRTCNSVCAAGQASGFDLRLACVASAATPGAVRGCCSAKDPCVPVTCEGR